ncbi:MAG: PIN domain-containing protein [Candidatus Entotheonellia bacterium]
MNPASGGGLLRAVVDTNVYISAFLHPERPIFQIVEQAVEQRYRLLISPAIVNEVGRVLRETFD